MYQKTFRFLSRAQHISLRKKEIKLYEKIITFYDKQIAIENTNEKHKKTKIKS